MDPGTFLSQRADERSDCRGDWSQCGGGSPGVVSRAQNVEKNGRGSDASRGGVWHGSWLGISDGLLVGAEPREFYPTTPPGHRG